jgi:molybdate transport system regulatory protein
MALKRTVSNKSVPKKTLQASGQIWLARHGEGVAGAAGEHALTETRLALLEKIAETGSITQAGKAVGISYRTAWLTVDHLNGISDGPLVERTTGGKSGGGTRLTPEGAALVRKFRTLREEHGKYLDRLRAGIEDFDRFVHLTRKLSLKTSARNQLFGTVESIRKEALNATVVLRLKGKDRIVSRITLEGLESLGLRKGEEAYALIKANWISIAGGIGAFAESKPGVRTKPAPAADGKENRMAGSVASLKLGTGNAEVQLKLDGGSPIISMVPLAQLKALSLKEGIRATAVFQASDVILGVAR